MGARVGVGFFTPEHRHRAARFCPTGKEKEKHLRNHQNFDHFLGAPAIRFRGFYCKLLKNPEFLKLGAEGIPCSSTTNQFAGGKQRFWFNDFCSLIPHAHLWSVQTSMSTIHPTISSQSVDPWSILYSNLWVLDYPHQNERMSSWKGTISKGKDRLPTSDHHFFKGICVLVFGGSIDC